MKSALRPIVYLSLPCNSSELNLDVVFCNGQTFRWTKDDEGVGWVGVSCHRLWRIWRLNEREIGFKVLHEFDCNEKGKSDAEVLREYFQLDVNLERLYHSWSSRDKHFAKLLKESRETLQGIRILRQDPVETLFAFICSANNNVPRISKMVEKLCQFYGHSVEVNSQSFYDFPTIAQMAAHLDGMEQTLRDAGFGYRAKSIAKTVEILANLDAELWLLSLRSLPYREAKLALMKLPGVGPKVADCICLMALDKHQVVPVDRHVFNLTTEIYMPEFLKKPKTFSNSVHGQIGAFFADLHGDYAGWAHSVLFSTRLRHLLKR